MTTRRSLTSFLGRAGFVAAAVLALAGCSKEEELASAPTNPDAPTIQFQEKTTSDRFLRIIGGIPNYAYTFKICPLNVFITTDPVTREVSYFCGNVPGCPSSWITLKDPQSICFQPGVSYWMRSVDLPNTPAIKFAYGPGYDECAQFVAARFNFNPANLLAPWSMSGTLSNFESTPSNLPC
jgi:hypothetical protein